jgi:hypothetical protein
MSSTASVVSTMSDGKKQVNTKTSQLLPTFNQLEGCASSIDTGQQFLQWLQAVLALPEVHQGAEKAADGGDSVLENEVGDSLALLESLSTQQYCMVSEKTTSLHLLEEQT